MRIRLRPFTSPDRADEIYFRPDYCAIHAVHDGQEMFVEPAARFLSVNHFVRLHDTLALMPERVVVAL